MKKLRNFRLIPLFVALVVTGLTWLFPKHHLLMPHAGSGISPLLIPDADWVVLGSTFQAQSFGHAVSSAGDVNGDSFTEILIGGGNHAYLFYGAPTGPDTTPDWVIAGQQYDHLGSDVRSAGDVNGDGYGDVIIGARSYSSSGAAFVYYGSPNGLGTTPDWMVVGDQANSDFGKAVSTAGDVNGDGYDDVMVGAHFYSQGQEYEGKVYVYYGSSAGLAQTPAWTYEGNLVRYFIGREVSTAGDVNGDGYDEILFGSFNNASDGYAYVFYGSPNGLKATPDWIGDSGPNQDTYGYTVNTVGDINKDGYDDILVGAPTYTHGQTKEGAAFLYLGSEAGLINIPTWIGESNQAGAFFGRGLDRAGDWNEDGYQDVIIGAPNLGRIYIFTGTESGLLDTPYWFTNGSSSGAFGYKVAGILQGNKQGIPMVIAGAPNYDQFQGGVFGYYCPTCKLPPTLTPGPTITATPTQTSSPTSTSPSARSTPTPSITMGSPTLTPTAKSTSFPSQSPITTTTLTIIPTPTQTTPTTLAGASLPESTPSPPVSDKHSVYLPILLR